ncbi:hypothetical protein [Nocardia sp. NPDC056100]|uniref:hypothetical protein n=1 Tax=Nocardia sp. NPDC056100 TaxID=3345712 RepID=UPI0035E0DDA8
MSSKTNMSDEAAVPKKGDVIDHTWRPLFKQPLPAGRPRSWYIQHNRRLKAMRLAIALLDSGAFSADIATNDKIRETAETVGVHWPSDATCRMVRRMMQAQR